jgi:hypothetical protein
MIREATKKEQQYHDLAAYYVGRASLCAQCELWPESEMNFGAALESLLHIVYGPDLKFYKLIAKFDADPLFDALESHTVEGRQCVTCLADKVRTLRNAVHPDCWQQITKQDVLQAQLTVIGVYHILAACKGRIANFQPAPDTQLSEMERRTLQEL